MADDPYVITNPKTGEKMKLEGNKWVPLQTAAPVAPVPAPPSTTPSVGKDVLDTAAPSLLRGGVGLVTAPSSMWDLSTQGMGWLAKKALPEGLAEGVDKTVAAAQDPKIKRALGGVLPGLGLPPYKKAMEAIEEHTGPLYEAKTTPGKYAQTALEFAPGALFGGSSLLPRAVKTGASALASEGAGQYFEGSPMEPWMRALGAIAGPSALSAPRKLVTQFPAKDGFPKMGDTVMAGGGPGHEVRIPSSVYTGNETLGKIEGSLIPKLAQDSKYKYMQPEAQKQALTDAMNETANKLPATRFPNAADALERAGKTEEAIMSGGAVKPYDVFKRLDPGNQKGPLGKLSHAATRLEVGKKLPEGNLKDSTPLKVLGATAGGAIGGVGGGAAGPASAFGGAGIGALVGGDYFPRAVDMALRNKYTAAAVMNPTVQGYLRGQSTRWPKGGPFTQGDPQLTAALLAAGQQPPYERYSGD